MNEMSLIFFFVGYLTAVALFILLSWLLDDDEVDYETRALYQDIIDDIVRSRSEQ